MPLRDALLAFWAILGDEEDERDLRCLRMLTIRMPVWPV